MNTPTTAPLRLGISACLLGEKVRYDGQHKRDAFLVDTLGAYVNYVPVCPEVECGLPVPREAMRLVGDVAHPRLTTIRTQRDLTDPMLSWAARRIEQLKTENLCGFIFKAKSPSSGLERVKVYNASGDLIGSGQGLFAAAFMKAFPLLPVEDEGRLQDPDLRENFIERIFTLQRYRAALSANNELKALQDFHAHHKYLIQAHSEAHLRSLGQLVAHSAGHRLPEATRADYERLLLDALRLKATPAKHLNVLQHMMGFLKNRLTADEKRELMDVFNTFRQGLIPLIVPVTLISHYVRLYAVDYLSTQAYLNPHPLELKLRNHA